MSILLPHIKVACAILQKDGLILATQRSETMSLPLKWEFPGGKLEQGELPEECLVRELQEELGITVRVGQRLEPLTHYYPSFCITLYPFLCDQLQGTIILHEHRDARWLAPYELPALDWAEADLPLITFLSKRP
jgi:8-oxo-dGTP diphosphatase